MRIEAGAHNVRDRHQVTGGCKVEVAITKSKISRSGDRCGKTRCMHIAAMQFALNYIIFWVVLH